MSVLTLLTDALLVAVLVWLLRNGGLRQARDRWERGRAASAREGRAVRLSLEDAERIVVIHRVTARRWDDLRPTSAVVVLEAGGDALSVRRGGDGSIVLEGTHSVAVVDAHSIDSTAAWGDAAPRWIAAPLVQPHPSGRGRVR